MSGAGRAQQRGASKGHSKMQSLQKPLITQKQAMWWEKACWPSQKTWAASSSQTSWTPSCGFNRWLTRSMQEKSKRPSGTTCIRKSWAKLHSSSSLLNSSSTRPWMPTSTKWTRLS